MPRKITVATTSLRPGGGTSSTKKNLAAAERLLTQAAAVEPDIVCLQELFSLTGIPVAHWPGAAETVPGPTSERIGALAKHFGSYVVCPILEQKGDRIYNASVLIDREGGIEGIYHKIHPTIPELEVGVVPGESVKVFETEFGRVGILVCFDVVFPDRWREAKAKGAEIVFWPSAYDGGLPLRSRASDLELYVVSAMPKSECLILDITGYPIASTGNYTDVAWARIDLEKRLFSTDYNMAQHQAIIGKYGQRVNISVLSAEGAFTLESNDPKVTVADIVEEFGLETQQDYFQRSADRQDAACRGATTKVQR
ncbi:MAG: carbon-nitrogen hydrolase family protein [Candidatus Latescibacteria bacterium]|jgi:predicted amidohydrolase|nr:carbon-nitrogen hydrolase family protein [Candidatus Latescibacterota bacterium]